MCTLMHVAVFCSGIYKVYIEMTEHIERDLKKFRDVTKELTYYVNKVGYLRHLFDW